MASVYQESPPLHQDLKVKIQDTSLVFPSQETPRKSMFLTNIDQGLNFSVETVYFFQPNKDFPPHVVAENLKKALGKILVPYDFLAGRLNCNAETGRLEIDCNAAGAVFVVASCEFTLEEIGDLVYPNPGFKQLIIKRFDNNILEKGDQPLCIFQVTSFKCGGFAMGLSTNHIAFDGLSFKIFLENLAAIAADKPLTVIPSNDRRALAARSPPRVTHDHPHMMKLNLPLGQEAPIFDAATEDLDFRIFRLTSDDIANLKAKAKAECDAQNIKHMTGFNVVTALIWRCKALSYGHNDDHADVNLERESRMLFAVDIRSKLNPPLPVSFTGNAVLGAYASAKCEELKEKPFSRIVEKVSEGAQRLTDDFIRSAIDWGEINKGVPNGEFLISSWWKLGFSKVEYPWGKAKYSCPVFYHRKDIILLLSNIDDDNGVNVLVSLPAKEMIKFETLLHEFLA